MPDAAPHTPEPHDPLPAVLVVGPGAVGSFLGGTLAAAGHAVTLLGRRVRDDDRHGVLLLEEPGGTREVPVRRVTGPEQVEGVPGLVILAVKAFHLPDALATASA